MKSNYNIEDLWEEAGIVDNNNIKYPTKDEEKKY